MPSKDIAICVENVSKCYRIGIEEQVKENFAQELVEFFKSPLQNYRKYKSLYEFDDIDQNDQSSWSRNDIIWALRNVSFELPHGEVLGIIGHNGAGKSTILKILSRITPPTTGEIAINGRVSSLLEVGTGFHPELTGRENVYLNGIILGMKKEEIDRKFDDIVEFSGVSKFLDTPVKRYSSGMQVRLAFSVAAHLDPDILIVDEVLAVGDFAFQKKCLGRMQEVAGEGRTVIFVSHNMGAISNLCTRAIWLDQGQKVAEGDVGEVIGLYLKEGSNINKANSEEWTHEGTGEARIRHISIEDEAGHERNSFGMGESVVVRINVDFFSDIQSLPNDIALLVSRADTGMNVLHLTNHDDGFLTGGISAGQHEITITIPNIMLYPSSYFISVWVCGYDFVRNVGAFQIVQTSVSKRNIPFTLERGVYHSPSIWRQLS
jgi:lipopolysaccharide transport system ATP-binding protein